MGRVRSGRDMAAKPKTPKPTPQTVTPEEPKLTRVDTLIALVGRPEGASLADLAAATGWRRHSVRGALAGAVRRKLGRRVTSQLLNGERRYSLGAIEQ